MITNPYKEARRIYYALSIGQEQIYDKDDFYKVRISLAIVKQRHGRDRLFKTSAKNFSICRVV